MPVGELAALASAVTFAFTSVLDKFFTRTYSPLTLGTLSATGGAIFAIVLMSATGRADDLAGFSLVPILLCTGGGIMSIGLGMPLYLLFLRSVDVSKAAPLSTGLSAVFSVISGLLILGEEVSNITLAGIVVVIVGAYLLSLSQRSSADTAQARWLGVRGLTFLTGIVLLWVVGTSLQREALYEIDPISANALRLTSVSVVLGVIVLVGRIASKRSAPQSPLDAPQAASGTASDTANPSPNLSPAPAAPREMSWYRPSKLSYLLPAANGSVSLGFGSLLMLVALDRAGLAVAFVLSTTMLFWVTILSVVFLRERLTLKTALGVVAMVSGVILIVL